MSTQWDGAYSMKVPRLYNPASSRHFTKEESTRSKTKSKSIVWSSPSTPGKSTGYLSYPMTQKLRNKMMESPMQKEMDNALKTIAKSGSKWNTSLKGIKTLAPTCLIAKTHL